ncbi:glycosyltransferase family 4 protein [Polaribacter sp.]|uniref:glycosyltransferase family 4 protein n=1 Tax=Polaribacter sp. TaxID=1920175 RepID=UPI004047B49A
MKILLLIPDLGIGGAQKQFVETAIHLNKTIDLEFQIVCINPNNEYLVNNNRKIDVIYLREKSGILSLIGAFFKYLIILFKFKPIIIHSWLGRAHRFSLFGRFFHESKIIFGFRNTANRNYSFLENIDFYFFSKLFVDLYFCNSKIQMNYLNSLYKIENNILHYIPNGFNLEIERSHFQPRLNSKYKILMPSRICQTKNQFEFLHFLSENSFFLDTFEFHFTGPVYDKRYYRLIMDLIDSNTNLQRSVFIKTENIQISTEFRSADFIFLNSSSEGFSNVILESWAFEKILIISSKCDSNNIIINGFNGFLFNSYLELINLLREVSSLDDSDWIKITNNGKKSLLDYSFEKIANEYINHYRNLLT